MKKLTTVFLGCAFVVVGLFAQKTPVVATVNVQRLMNDYTAFQAAMEKVKGSVAPVEDEMKKMQQTIQDIVTKGREAEAKVQNPALGDEAKEEARAEVMELQKQLQSEQVKLQQFRQQAQQLAQQGQKEELAPLQEKAIEAVRTVASDKGIDLVIATNNLIYADDSLEITDSVIAVLNAE
ncbi:OmpH family outer membrane protein [Coraliomargarita parva]|uniref:OmpH family outer membrane protein n=1 Tax=Coraliomargarita parva TaxID=3014050 RepID=UPI0022B2FC12|nr:OmpH family outer membrane protein [Coraliomargarita parva]